MNWSPAGYTALLLLALLWTAGIAASPLLMHNEKPIAGMGVRLLYSPICHQDVERTHHLYHWPLTVCHRCSGVYFAFTGTVLMFPLFRRHRAFASFSVRRSAIFILPMFLDYMLDVAGVWSNSPVTRTVSGAMGGIGLALFIVPAWMESWRQVFYRSGQTGEKTI